MTEANLWRRWGHDVANAFRVVVPFANLVNLFTDIFVVLCGGLAAEEMICGKEAAPV